MDIDSVLSNSDLNLGIIDADNYNKECDSVSISSATTVKVLRQKNPVEEHLTIQLNCIQNQIDQINSNIEVIKSVSENTLKNIASRAVFKEDSSSESDNDLYTSNGEPIIKKRKKSKYYEKTKVLQVHNVWQKVVDDRWIIGVELESTASFVLQDPTIYICQKGKDSYSGVSVFWSFINKFWFPTESIDSKGKVVATAVLDLPIFESTSEIQAHGVIFCEHDDKSFQTPLPNIQLLVKSTIDNSLSLNFDEKGDAEISLLALKVISIDRAFVIPATGNPLAPRIIQFLKKYEFEEICNVCILLNFGSLQHCVLEILPAEDGDLQVFISARSQAQLSAVIQLVKKEFPELLDLEEQQSIDEAAEALREELKCYLSSSDPANIQRARVKSDLLIP